MNTLAPETLAAIDQLEAALAAKAIPAKDAQTCAKLLDNLRRPVRVGLIGGTEAGPATVLSMILGQDPIPAGFPTPTLEIVHGASYTCSATLGDATVLNSEGWPDADLMAHNPVFIRLTGPIEALRRISFLHLSLGDDYPGQLSALNWAASRLELTLWCSQGFPPHEADLWSNAPDPMKHHAFLVATGRGDNPGTLRQRVGADFEGVFAVSLAEHLDAHGALDLGPAPGLKALMRRLNADIDEAQLADLDAARLFLYRFGQSDAARASMKPAAKTAKAAAPKPAAPKPPQTAPAAQAPAPAAIPEPPPRDPEAVATLKKTISEPMLYLKRRARALSEMLDWQESPSGDWASDVLEHCCETTEVLRDRADAWPEDDGHADALRECLDEAWDVAILLQVEGGDSQARDAASLMLQLRGEFERALAA
ncbi:MAG: hypothetical protein AAGF68_08825 [Pseudomonadota bacterium]